MQSPHHTNPDILATSLYEIRRTYFTIRRNAIVADSVQHCEIIQRMQSSFEMADRIQAEAARVRMLRRLVVAQEEERRRIARDLHDEIGSSLGSIALITQEILASGGDEAQTHDDLIEIKHIADETVSAMRDITRLIQSDRYGSDDLATLLRETAARLLRTIPHTVTLEGASSAHKLPVDRQRDLILMFKEALHNITRHAAATAVDIRLVQSNTRISISLHDNGHGFDPAAATEGMGLTNLRRRAAKHGGSVRIESAPAQGTTLTITLPVHD